MINFSKILNIRKTAEQAKTVKQSSIYKVRAISKIPVYISVPQVVTQNLIKNGRILHQFNLSLSQNFRITEPIKYAYSRCVGLLTIKYRVGSTVYRYAIWGNSQRTLVGLTFYDVYSIPQYTNQLIGKNCCFEFWGVEENSGPIQEVWGHPALKLKTSLSLDPTSISEIESVVSAGDPIDVLNLGSTFPEALPTSQETIAWLDNVI